MPGHLYLRVGRYADAALANVRARTADVFYTRNELQPYGPCHNQYFGVYAACLAGMSANALDGSSHMRNVYAVNLTRGDAPGVEQGWNARLTTMVRFSLWDDILNDTNVVPIGAPPTPYATVLRHYSKGLAYLHSNTNLNNNVMAATQELNELRIAQQQILARNAKDPTGFNGMSVHLANVANDTLTAGILYFDPANINYAIALLQKAADNQNRWHLRLSVEHMVGCCHSCGYGCGDGFPNYAWRWLTTGGGIVTGGQFEQYEWCSSYTLKPCNHYNSKNDSLPSCEKGIPSKTPQCPTKCDLESNYKVTFNNDKRIFNSAFAVDKDPKTIVHEIFENGPVTAGMNVYEDWLSYRSGVYKWNGVGSIIGGHAVRILGWGVSDDQLNYWIVANSFGKKWGDLGTFKIVRGDDTCIGGGEGTCIENSVVAGTF